MKKIFLFIAFAVIISCKSQTYPLRTYGIDYPKDSYVKDINNELQSYEGMWKGSWNNKTFFISFKKIKYYKSFLDSRSYYADILVGKFKIHLFSDLYKYNCPTFSNLLSQISE